MERVNLFTVEVGFDEGDPEGYNTAYKRLGSELGASMLGGTVYELPPGQSICPYHYEYGNEDKVGIWPGDERDNILVRRESNVDYWDREV